MSCLEDIRRAGVVGAGGAGFPTYKKLAAKASFFIVNAAECEPLIETDKFLIREKADELIKGILLIADLLEAKHRVIAIKRIYEKEIAALHQAIDENGADIRLHLMDAFYPAGDEQIITLDVTGKTVPERGIPLSCSAVVDNVCTVLWCYEASKGKNICEKYLSVVGEVKAPVVLKVPLGTPVIECVKAAGARIDKYIVIMGGPMMGKVYTKEEEIARLSVTKTDNNILVLPPDHLLAKRIERNLLQIKNQAKSACIQCRFCTQMCPRYLSGHNVTPNLIMRNLYLEDQIADNDTYLSAFGSAANCSECGVCELYACPMQLSPRRVNAFLKGQLRARGIDVPKNMNPQKRADYETIRIPTGRLVARLGLAKYEHLPLASPMEVLPDMVTLPLKQNIGVPAEAVVHTGDRVQKGDLIAAAAPDKLSANLHSSVDGNVKAVTDTEIVIERG